MRRTTRSIMSVLDACVSSESLDTNSNAFFLMIRFNIILESYEKMSILLKTKIMFFSVKIYC